MLNIGEKRDSGGFFGRYQLCELVEIPKNREIIRVPKSRQERPGEAVYVLCEAMEAP